MISTIGVPLGRDIQILIKLVTKEFPTHTNQGRPFLQSMLEEVYGDDSVQLMLHDDIMFDNTAELGTLEIRLDEFDILTFVHAHQSHINITRRGEQYVISLARMESRDEIINLDNLLSFWNTWKQELLRTNRLPKGIDTSLKFFVE